MCNCQQSNNNDGGNDGGLVGAVIGVVKDAISGKPVVASKEIVSQRLNACAHCNELKRYYSGMPDGVAVITADKCMKCGCKVKLKASMANQQCPLGKWDVHHEDA